MQHAEHSICIPCCHFFLRHSRRSICSFHTIHYQTYPKVKVFPLASQSRASCCFYSTFLYLLKSFCSSMSFLRQQMRNHGTHRERLKHAHPPWWTKRFDQNRNTHFNDKIWAYIRMFFCVIREFPCNFVVCCGQTNTTLKICSMKSGGQTNAILSRATLYCFIIRLVGP